MEGKGFTNKVWQDTKVVNFEWARGGMSLVTEKKSKGVTVSRLLIQKAVRTDSGTYMCAPQNAHPAFVKIVVLEQANEQSRASNILTLYDYYQYHITSNC
ncbi:Roundabout 4 [Orchesella cincta]|uniref:Roundabout 4 n=1 Tax=Orchesella cincta TaxID=48709 RepID=A0A1D2N559_ORCCI|nr:Roundabout 4 [Orchesella cincta]